MFARHKKLAFTLIELLTVLGIIAILVAVLIPALSMVKNAAKQTQQTVQFASIEMGLTAFKNDSGDYPPSSWNQPDYCGSQKLSEALLGWDLLGFHPDSAWRADGDDDSGGDTTYDPAKNRDADGDNIPDTLTERVGPYLKLEIANAFKLGDLFINNGPLDPNTFVICDVFGKKSITVGTKNVKAGAPVLYYRANTSSKTIKDSTMPNNIYNPLDNRVLIYVKKQEDGKTHPLEDPSGSYSFFYDYITDPQVSTGAVKWPYRPDSYILISAGADGEYGTSDDMHNF